LIEYHIVILKVNCNFLVIATKGEETPVNNGEFCSKK